VAARERHLREVHRQRCRAVRLVRETDQPLSAKAAACRACERSNAGAITNSIGIADCFAMKDRVHSLRRDTRKLTSLNLKTHHVRHSCKAIFVWERTMIMNGLKWLMMASLAVGFTAAAHAEDFDAGKSEFLSSCASCHGTDGKGNGPVREQLKVVKWTRTAGPLEPIS